MAKTPIKEQSATRQIAFHTLLVGARRTWLIDAQTDAASQVEPMTLKAELLRYAPRDAQQILVIAREGDDWTAFKQQIAEIVGCPVVA